MLASYLTYRLPDWFYGLSAISRFYSAQRLDLFVQCVRLSRLSVGFRTHSKICNFISFHFISYSWLYYCTVHIVCTFTWSTWPLHAYFCGTVIYRQLNSSEFRTMSAKIGTSMFESVVGKPPASMTSIVRLTSSASLLANTDPAVPPPTTTTRHVTSQCH